MHHLTLFLFALVLVQFYRIGVILLIGSLVYQPTIHKLGYFRDHTTRLITNPINVKVHIFLL